MLKSIQNRLHAGLGLLASVGVAVALALPVKAELVITAGTDKKVKVWDSKTPDKPIKEIVAHEGAVNAVALTPDGKLLITAGADKKVKVWKFPSGDLVKEVVAHDGAVTALAVNADGTKVFTGGADKKVKIWDAGNLDKEPKVIDAHDDAVLGIAVLEQAGFNVIISAGADGTVKPWEMDGSASGLFPAIPTGHADGLKAMQGNFPKMALYTGGKEGKMKYWSSGMGNGDFEGSQGGAINRMLVMPDGEKTVTGGSDGSVVLWDNNSFKLATKIPDAHAKAEKADAPYSGVTALAVFADGKMILTGGSDKKVKVWSAEGKLLKEVEAHDGAVTALLIIPEKKAEK